MSQSVIQRSVNGTGPVSHVQCTDENENLSSNQLYFHLDVRTRISILGHLLAELKHEIDR